MSSAQDKVRGMVTKTVNQILEAVGSASGSRKNKAKGRLGKRKGSFGMQKGRLKDRLNRLKK